VTFLPSDITQQDGFHERLRGMTAQLPYRETSRALINRIYSNAVAQESNVEG